MALSCSFLWHLLEEPIEKLLVVTLLHRLPRPIHSKNLTTKAKWWMTTPNLHRRKLTGTLRREDVNRHGGQIKADMPTTVLRQANLAVLYLPLPGFALQLPHHFNNLAQSCRPYGMSSRQEPS